VLTLRNGLGTVHDLESQLLRPVAFGPAIRRYERLRPTSFLVYPYIEGTLIDEERLRKEFPHTWNYLEHYRYMLESRSSIAQSGLAWYELVRRRDENLLSSPKLAMRDLSMKTAFALDDLGDTFIVGGTVVVPEDEGLLLPLLGFLNSSAANWYLQQSTPAFRARFMKVEPQHLSKVPVPNALLEDDGIRSRMADLVSQMIRAMADNRPRDIKQLDDAINSEVYRAAKINPAEVGL